MQQFLHYLVSNLVNNPDEILVEEELADGHLALKLTVAESDMGIVIGKHGQTIAAIRSLVRLRNQLKQEYSTVVVHLQEHTSPTQE